MISTTLVHYRPLFYYCYRHPVIFFTNNSDNAIPIKWIYRGWILRCG